MILNSGESALPFRFKLVGFEKLNLVFAEVYDQKMATENSDTNPRNLTLKEYKA